MGVAGGTRRPDRGATRVLRVGVLGTTSLALAAGAHLLGGGRLPSPGVLAVVAFLLGLSAALLTVRRCRFPVLLAVLAGQQALLHVVLDTAARVGPACGTAMAGMGHGPAAHAGFATAVGSCSSLPPAGAMTSMASVAMPGWVMWAAHLVAVAATAALLARGEAWLWRVADALVRASTARPVGGRRAASAGVLVGVPRALRPLLLASGASPRGPPAGRRLRLVGPA